MTFMPIKPEERELLSRFDSFFEAVGGVFAKIVVDGDIAAFDFVLRALFVLGTCAKAQMAREHPHLDN